jgi:stress response protein YsnF
VTRPESSASDQPFPRAHSLPAESADDPHAGADGVLPLEGVPSSAGQGWSVRLPIRAEQVTVSKDVVVRERVLVRRREVADVAHVEAEVRHEELRTSTEGELELDHQA